MRTLSAVTVLLALALSGCAATPVSTPELTPLPTVPVTPALPQAPTPTPTLVVSPSPTIAPTLQSTPSPTTQPPSPTPTPTTPPSPTPTQPPLATPTQAPTATPTAPPVSNVELKGACISMVNEPYQGYERYLMLDVSFEEANIEAIRVAITGANDDQPADGNEPLPGIWQVTLGLNQGTQSSDLSFISADVTVDGEVESFLAALEESIGDMSQLRPGRPVGESCGGF